MLNQKGAIFGLDARITLMIFTVISVISAATLTVDMARISAGALADEIRGIGDAVEGMHNDMKVGIHKVLVKPNPENAFNALIDEKVIKPGIYRPRWIGPYIKHLSNVHPKHGKMKIEKQGREHTASCHPSAGCHLWLTLDAVRIDTLEELNSSFDGDAEVTPRNEGRIQWSKSEYTESQDIFRLWYRIAPAIQ